MRIKVMNLDSWMTWKERREKELSSGYYSIVEPRFNRPGIYLVGKDCWFELEDGRAFGYRRDNFVFSLKTLDVYRLNEKQVAALQNIVDQKLATKEQRALLVHYYHAMEVRSIGRRTRLFLLTRGITDRIKRARMEKALRAKA